MKNEFVRVQNVVKLSKAFRQLEERSFGIPGLGLLYGFTGAGKTRSIAWLVNQVDGAYIRLNSFDTPTSMLALILEQYHATPLRTCSKMLNKSVELIGTTKRALFVDEADYLLNNVKMLEALRDIHDNTGVPVWLIGMDGFERGLIHYPKITRRISQWVEFNPCNLQDAALVAEKLCEIQVAQDLIVKLNTQANGSIGLLVVGLSQIEDFAKRQRWTTIDADQWGDQKFFFARGGNGGQQG